MERAHLLYAQSDWLNFHLQHSAGGTAVYCRGAGATVRSIIPGDLILFVRSRNRPLHIFLWGYFLSFELVRIADGWNRFRTQLGASSHDDWMQLAENLPNLRGREEFGALSVTGLVVQHPPIPASDVLLRKRNSGKGFELDPEELQRFLHALARGTVQPNQYRPTGVDSRRRLSRNVFERLGQPDFRQALVERYGLRCMITETDVSETIEAAHIIPYRDKNDNHPENGLLLRSDIHALYDRNLLSIHPVTLLVELHPHQRVVRLELRCAVLRLVTHRLSPFESRLVLVRSLLPLRSTLLCLCEARARRARRAIAACYACLLLLIAAL